MSDLLPINATPSALAAADITGLSRRETINFDQAVVAVGYLGRRYVNTPGRLTVATGYRRTAGDTAGSTTVEIKVNGTSILDAPMTFAQADGDDQKVYAVLDTDHAEHDGAGIKLKAGDYIEAQVTAAETANPAGLSVQIELING